METFKISPFVASVEKIISQKDYSIITGYLGNASDKTKTRIYPDKAALDHFLEIDSQRILHKSAENKDDEFQIKFIVESKAKTIVSTITKVEELFGGENTCGCQHDDVNSVSKKNDSLGSLRNALCRFRCILNKQGCIDNAIANGMPPALAANLCTDAMNACKSGCDLSGSGSGSPI